VITAVAGKPVDSRESFSTYTSTIPSGQPVTLTVSRGSSSSDIAVRPIDPPQNLGLRILDEIAGLKVVDRQRSVFIDEVTRGSRSENVGLAPGDVIVGINGTEVTSVKALNDALIQSADRSSIVLSIARDRYIYNLTFPMGI
jgi:S1-C subfamily serine protease